MTQEKIEWEKEFDKKLDGYWSGYSIPDEIKFFIRQKLAERDSYWLKKIEEGLKIKEYKCHCGCNFGDACLCKEEKRGFDFCLQNIKKRLLK